MSNLYWLTDEQMARLQPYFPKSHALPMCNLYRLPRAPAEVAKHSDAEAQGGLNFPEETYPCYPGMVIRNVDGKRVAQQMNWGFPLRLKSMKPTSKPKHVTTPAMTS